MVHTSLVGWAFNDTVYHIIYVHGWLLLFSIISYHQLMIHMVLHIFFNIAWLALIRWYDCAGVSEVTMKDIGKIYHYLNQKGRLHQLHHFLMYYIQCRHINTLAQWCWRHMMDSICLCFYPPIDTMISWAWFQIAFELQLHIQMPILYATTCKVTGFHGQTTNLVFIMLLFYNQRLIYGGVS